MGGTKSRGGVGALDGALGKEDHSNSFAGEEAQETGLVLQVHLWASRREGAGRRRASRQVKTLSF